MFNRKNKQPVQKTPYQRIKPSEFDLFEIKKQDGLPPELDVVTSSIRRFLARDDVQTWETDAYKQDVQKNAIDMPPDVAEMVTEARDFVQSLTGVEVNSPVYYFQNMEPGTSGFLTPETGYLALKKVDVSNDPDSLLTEYYRRMMLTSVLVHELMHGVDMGRRRVAYINIKETGKKRRVNTMSLIGNLKYDLRVSGENGKPGRVGNFFVEGFAEWGAACYREATDPVRKKGNAADMRVSMQRGEPRMHVRYINTNKALDQGGNKGYKLYPAYPAEAMSRISEYTGVDLFRLKMDMLNPAIALEAEKKFIQTIEGLEPGLYAALRDAPYTKKGFIAGYRAVNHAIEAGRQRDAERRKREKKLARLATTA